MTASKPFGTPYPPCLHPTPLKENLGWLVIWVVVAVAALAINATHPGLRQPMAHAPLSLSSF